MRAEASVTAVRRGVRVFMDGLVVQDLATDGTDDSIN